MDYFNSKNFEKLNAYLSNAKKQIPVIGYGAPTKATSSKIGKFKKNSIDFLVKDNPLKIHKYLPKHGIEIKSLKN